jgi:hypothetical protein
MNKRIHSVVTGNPVFSLKQGKLLIEKEEEDSQCCHGQTCVLLKTGKIISRK